MRVWRKSTDPVSQRLSSAQSARTGASTTSASAARTTSPIRLPVQEPARKGALRRRTSGTPQSTSVSFVTVCIS